MRPLPSRDVRPLRRPRVVALLVAMTALASGLRCGSGGAPQSGAGGAAGQGGWDGGGAGTSDGADAAGAGQHGGAGAHGGAGVGGATGPLDAAADAPLDAATDAPPPVAKNYQITGTMPSLKAALATRPGTLAYTKLVIHDQFLAESCSIGDYNNDGVPDISSGRTWYEGTSDPATTFRV